MQRVEFLHEPKRGRLPRSATARIQYLPRLPPSLNARLSFAGGIDIDASGREAPAMPLTSAAGASQHRGTAMVEIDQIVNRVLAANRVIERISEPCPQGTDCAGDGEHTRIFDCEQGCGFRGCTACLMEHESEPHWSDSDTAREMWQIGDRMKTDRVIG